MTKTPPHPDSSTPPRRRRGRFGVWMLATNLVFALLLIYAVLSLTSRPIPLPGAIADMAELRMNAALGDGTVEVGDMQLLVGTDGVPRITMNDLLLRDPGGLEVLHLNSATARLAPLALATARIAPTVVSLSGAQITLRRAADGAFALSFSGAGNVAAASPPGEVLERIATAMEAEPLSRIRLVEARDITISLEDARSGRIWQASNAVVDLAREDDGVQLSILSDVFNGTEDLARVQMSLQTRENGGAEIAASVDGMPSADIALQSPALRFLSLIDAPIDGSMRASVDSAGMLEQLAASLDIGAGAFQPTDNQAISFDRGRSYLVYDPDEQRVTFTDLSVDSKMLSVSGQGHAYLRDLDNGWPDRLVGQLQLQDATFTAPGFLPDTLHVDGGAVDLRLQFDPFEVEFGQAVLTKPNADDARQIRGQGRIAAGEDGWHASVDFAADMLDPDDVLAVWPLTAIKGTRAFVAENILGGTLFDIKGSLRIKPGAPMDAAVSYDFRDAEVRFLPEFPPIRNGRGRATFEDNAYTMALTEGQVSPQAGGEIELAGSVFQVPDVTLEIERADIDLRTQSSLRAALEVLDNPPFEILRKSGARADLAEASAVSQTRIGFDLLKNLTTEDVAFRTNAELRDVVADNMLPDRRITAERLEITADPTSVQVGGTVDLGGLPVRAEWTQLLAADKADRSQITASVTVDGPRLETLGISLPEDTVTGQTTADVTVALTQGEAPAYTLVSDLEGLGLRLDAIDWSKPAGAASTFQLSGTMADALAIDAIDFTADGLSVSGALRLNEDGSLAEASFGRVRLGDWLDAPVQMRPSGGEMPDIAILGGRADLTARQASGRGGPSGNLEIALDELVISDTLVLRPFTARMPAGRVGRFDARVGGRAPIEGDLIPQPQGMAIRIRAADGGRVLGDAGILQGLSGGPATVTLVPNGTPGGFNGQLSMADTLMRDAPAAAMLLDAISVVGLLDELRGSGILFDTIDARFSIGRDQVRLYEAAAVGGSLGISLDGVYDLATREMDMQGVVSPVYLFNGIGAIFTRPGEGLFGISFRMLGPAVAPEITVNPLSILTPGMFREIFRRPPPAAAATQ